MFDFELILFLKANTRSKKLKLDTNEELMNLVKKKSLCAIGTANGQIILYSTALASVHSILTKSGHSDQVNGISWHTPSDSLFSCSNDKQVIEWSIAEGKIKS